MKMAFAALAIGSVTLPPASVAQTREAADAAEALAPADDGQPEALEDTQTEATDPTWDEVVQAIEEAIAPALIEEGATVDAAAADPVAEAGVALADWVIAARDNERLPFIIIDKMAAALLVFDSRGQLLGTTPALLGVASGDDSTPGIGERELSAIAPEERTTPAGRFLAQYGFAAGGRSVLWVDYETAIALHPVVTGNKRERRAQRLSSPSPADNRITYGCINVPANFYEEVIQPLFAEAGGVVYILPDTKPVDEVFPAFRVQNAHVEIPPGPIDAGADGWTTYRLKPASERP